MDRKKTIKSIEHLIHPRSVAVIGASRDPQSVGYGVFKNLVDGSVFKGTGVSKGFPGKVYAVNPHATKLLGRKCYADISLVPADIDLAIICVPAIVVPKVALDCAMKKAKAIIVLSAGFAENGSLGLRLQNQVIKVCRKFNMRLLGPNCLGLIRPDRSLNASFAVSMPLAGNVAFVTQSGAIADSVIDWAIKEKYAFSTIISLGNSADVDAADLLDWLGQDPQTKSIALYLEGIRDGRKFIRCASKLKGKKPVVVLKGGRTSQGGAAAASHTGALAGDFRVFEGAMRQSGVTMAQSIEELFDLARALAKGPKLKKNGVAVVTNGGGVGVLCADYCVQFGLNLVKLKKTTIRKLDATRMMHPSYSRKNPLDIIGDARPNQYKASVETLLAEPYIHGLIVVQTLQTMTNPVEDAKIVIRAHEKFPKKPIVCVFMGGKYSHAGSSLLEKHNIPEYNDPRKAVIALAVLGGLL